MIIISGSDSPFLKVLSEQKEYDKEYIWSIFNIKIKVTEGWLVYNTMTRLLAFINFSPECKCNSIGEDEYRDLIKNWFIVPVDFDETKLYDELDNLMSYCETSNDYATFIVFVTTNCNARCSYCFEKEMAHKHMSISTAEKLVSYITKMAGEKRIRFQWFGGEPILNAKVIDNICGLMKKNNLYFESSIITNGSLFNKRLIDKAAENWNLKKAQISLDGTDEIYRKTKKYINIKTNPFDLVINNVKMLLKAGVSVTIRLNMSIDNANDLLSLIDVLHNRIGIAESLQIYIAPLYEYQEKSSRMGDINEIKELLLYYKLIYQKIEEYNYSTNNLISIKYFRRHCMADNDNSFAITPDGKITKCEHYTETEVVGDVINGVSNFELINNWKEKYPKTDYCKKCAFYAGCVRLKKCPNNYESCTQLYRDQLLIDYERSMAQLWKKYKMIKEI